METTLRNRLTYGPLMLGGLFLLLFLDHNFGGWTRNSTFLQHLTGEQLEHGLQGVGILFLLFAVAPLAIEEITILFTAERVRPYRMIAAVGSGAIVLHAFLTQFNFFKAIAASTFAFTIVFVMIAA